jgi:hypothetical protein
MRGSVQYVSRYVSSYVSMGISTLIAASIAVLMSATVMVSSARGQDLQDPRPIEGNPSYDGRITFARLRYDENRDAPCTCPLWGKGLEFGWQHDYPRAERSLMQIAATELRLNVRTDSSMMIKADDPEIMKYPSLYISEPGCWNPTEREIKSLRKYLFKGGFLVIDDLARCNGTPEDFEASRAHVEEVMHKLLPDNDFLPLDITTPALNRFFRLNFESVKDEINKMGAAQGEMLVFGAYDHNDPKRRLLVIANYNVGLHRAWYFEAVGTSAANGHDAYKYGVNLLLAGLTQY